MKVFTIVFTILMVCLILLEGTSRILSHSKFVLDATDIQSVSVLRLKLQRFLTSPTPRAIFIGDSVINGATLGEHGDVLWRQHTIDQHFQQFTPFKSTLNLGFNGALPCDLFYLYRHYLKNISTQLLIFDIGIRSFASDFESETAALSRPWLKDYYWQNGLLQINHTADLRTKYESQLSLFLLNHSDFLNLRDFLQWRFLEGPIGQFLPTTLKKWQHHHTNQAEDLAALLPAKARYSRINVKAESRQGICLMNLLQEIMLTKTPTLIVLSREKPTLENALLTSEKFNDWRIKLKNLISSKHTNKIQYIENIPGLKTSMYLDHIHVNTDGNTLIAKELARKF